MLKCSYMVRENENGLKVLGSPFWSKTEVDGVKQNSLCELVLYSDEYKTGDRITLNYNPFTAQFETVIKATIKIRFKYQVESKVTYIVERPVYIEHILDLEDTLYNLKSLKSGLGKVLETY